MHVLERERQRELGRELAFGNPLQLGSLPRRHERAAAKRVHYRLGLKAQPASQSYGRGNRFGREREPGVVHQLQPCSGPGLANPDRALAERVEQRSDTRTRLAGTRREDHQLAAFGRILASRHRRVEEHHVRTLSTGHGRDAVEPRHANGAHLGPDRTRRQRSEHALVPGDRHDGIGVGHHRHHDPGSPRRVGGALGDLRAELSQVPGRLHRAVPDDRRDASAQSTGRHPMAHRSDAEHRNGLVRPCHQSPPCRVCASCGSCQHHARWPARRFWTHVPLPRPGGRTADGVLVPHPRCRSTDRL